ncbi:MAG: alpha/beta hydrolase [Chlamydiae bacterium CG10_big_fil_rev_8_21_14_0_10_35_9]|nr:MAG: alpha/beta hydrolase [Chlamydiae bacterium CG10_big_fil_rev_8_21_14_0_10_35_9]
MLVPKKLTCSALELAPGITLYHTGPSLDKGPMPAVFYFALSGEDSLCLDPFNQPVQFLSDYPIRVFSLTLPAHEANLPPQNALSVWADDMTHQRDILSEFIEQARLAISYVIEQKLTSEDTIALAGLSRGGLLASLIAAEEKRARFILLFAPVTILAKAKEFEKIQDNPLVKKANAFTVVDHIYDRHIKAYIGNRDVRVGTRNCFDFIEALSHRAFENKIRSPQIEMLLSPSIGHQGHGTPPHIFKSGANWLVECLLKI